MSSAKSPLILLDGSPLTAMPPAHWVFLAIIFLQTMALVTWIITVERRISLIMSETIVGTPNGVTVSALGTVTTLGLANALRVLNLTANTIVTSTLQFTNFAASCMVAPLRMPVGTDPDFTYDCGTPMAGWTDIPLHPIPRSTGANVPSFNVFRGAIRAYEFVGNAANMRELYGYFHIPHQIAPGTGIYYHVHWAPDAASPTGNITWNFEYSYANGNGTSVFPTPATISITATMPSQYTHMITEIATPALTDLQVDGIILLRLYRDAALATDTSTNSAFLFFIDAHVNIAKFGTKNRNVATGGFYD